MTAPSAPAASARLICEYIALGFIGPACETPEEIATTVPNFRRRDHRLSTDLDTGEDARDWGTAVTVGLARHSSVAAPSFTSSLLCRSSRAMQ
jgi:hypothetical protein